MLKKNIIGLAWIQLINYLSPLVALPILTRNLGLHDFGLYIFYSGIANFIAVLADMGVGNIATQRIVLADSTTEKDTHYVTIMAIKLGFLMLSVCCLYAITRFFFADQFDYLLFVLAALGGASIALAPQFYFLAVGESVKLVVIVSIGKAVFLTTLIVFAAGGMSVRTALLATFLPALCATLVANGIIVLKIGSLRQHVAFHNMKAFLAESRVFALSNLMVWTYTSSPALLIAKLYGTDSAALYGAAEKIVIAFKALYGPIQQGAHPWVLSALKDDVRLYRARARQLILFLAGFGLATTVVLYGGAHTLLYLLGKDKLSGAQPILVIMGVLPLLTSLTAFLGNFVLIPLGRHRVYLAAIGTGFATYAMTALLSTAHGPTGIVYAMVAAETVILVVMTGAVLRRLTHLPIRT